jgi:hypothetical protein
VKKKYSILLFLISLVSFSQNARIENLKKDYDLQFKKNGFILLKDKQNSSKIKIANADGEIIYSFTYNKNTSFLSGFSCGKFFTAKVKGSANDGGGFTIFEFVDVEMHDLKNPNVGIKTNFTIADGAHRELFEIYKIFDNTDKIGLINSCGEVIVAPKYNRIGKFNELGQAIAYLNDSFTVIDTLGNSLINRSFKHGQKNIGKYDNEFYDDIKDNRVNSSDDGMLFGIYDFKENKQLIQNNYDKVSRLSNLYFYNENNKNNFPYVAEKNDVIQIIDYSSLKDILPMSIGANMVSSVTERNNKNLVVFSKKKKIIKQLGPNLSSDESKFFKNIYYDGKILFDPLLEIKDLDFYNYPFIRLQLYNGDSMFYDIDQSKFIITVKGALAQIDSFNEIYAGNDNKMQNRYQDKKKYFNISIACVGPDCHSANSKRYCLFDIDGNMKTKFLQEAHYAIIQIDKTQEKFLYLVYYRANSMSSVYSLLDNNGKVLLDNFKISNTEKDFDFLVYNNLLVLNEDMGNNVYGKTAFDVNGNMSGERFLYSLKPMRNQPKDNQKDNSKTEAPVNNRFLKKQ